MVTLTPERKARHELLNVISSNQAMVYLERKNVKDAVQECQIAIKSSLQNGEINDEIFIQLYKVIDETFEEFM